MVKRWTLVFSFLLVLSLALATTSCSGTKSVEEYLQDGQDYLEQGDYGKAIAALEEARKREPESAQMHRLLGEALAGSERWPEAVKEFEAYQALESQDPTAYFLLGQAYVHTDELDKAAATFAEGVRINPAFLTEHRKEVEKVAQDILQAGQKALEEGDLALATELLDVVAPLVPGRGEVYLALAQAHLEVNNFSQALSAFAQAVELSPELATEHAQEIDALVEKGLEMSQTALDAGNLQQSAQIAEASARLAPDNAKAHFLLGNAYNEANRFDQAIEQYQTVLDLDPDSSSARTNLGVVYYKLGRLEAAIQEYKLALEIEPDDAETHYLLGAAYVQMEGSEQEQIELLKKAAAEFETALALNDQLAPAYIGLGNVYLLRGDAKAALDALEDATALAPNSPEAYFALGQVHVQLGNEDQARMALEHVLSLNPAPLWRDRTEQLLESLNAP